MSPARRPGFHREEADDDGVSQPPNPPENTPAPQGEPSPTAPLQPDAPPWSTAPAPAASPPPAGGPPPIQGPPPPGSGQPGGAPGRWWRAATATPGRRLGTAAAALLAVLGLVGVLALGALAVGAVAFGRGEHGRVGQSSRMDDGGGMNRQGRGDGQGYGPGGGQGNRQGQGNGQGYGDGNDQQSPWGPGTGTGQRRGGSLGNGDRNGMGGMGALSSVLHGEFTTSATGTPTVMLFQLGQVTAVSGTTSMTVKSTDGFTATYALTKTTTMTAQPTVGASVRVLAAKDGATASSVVVLGAGTGSTS